jgi:hypothetical protein
MAPLRIRSSSPGSPKTQNATAPSAPKLRDSCDACASSKLKCSKDKPICSRCSKRGLTCEYVATKRGGRKPNNRSSSISESRASNHGSRNTTAKKKISTTVSADTVPDDQTQLPSPSNSFALNPMTSDTDHYLPSPGSVQLSPKPTTCASADPFPNLFSPTERGLFKDCNADLATEGNDNSTPFSFSLADISDVDNLSQTDIFPTSIVNGSGEISFAALFNNYSAFEDTVTGPLDLSTPTSHHNNHASPLDVHMQGHRNSADSEHSCLVRALDLMKEIFPQSSNACTIASTQTSDRETTACSLTIHEVVAENAAMVDSVTEMLKCSCSQDGYLLTIMALVVFKVLGRYAAASQKPGFFGGVNSPSDTSQAFQPHRSSMSRLYRESTAAAGRYSLDRDHSARMAAQLVLSELHRVRYLVNELSLKLKIQAMKNTSQACSLNVASYCGMQNFDMTLPLSGVMLDRLELDLKEQLKSISSQVLERLRTL